jgi:hypothetical protein
MQGLIAYYYDYFKPNNWMELNHCRHNHMGMDVLYRAPPNFWSRHKKVGQCRNNQDTCEDCMVTPLDQIYSIHYTQCRKPWNCIGEAKLDKSQKMNIPIDNVNLDHCMVLQSVWHSTRRDLEMQLIMISQSSSALDESSRGDYKRDVFHGHCFDNGGDNYVPLNMNLLPFISELYGNTFKA